MAGWIVWIAAALLVAVVGLVALQRRIAPLRDAGPRTPGVVRLVHVGAFVALGFTVLATLVGALSALLSPQVTATVPFRSFWPALYPTVEIGQGPAATIVGGAITEGRITVEGLDLGTRAALAGETLARGAATALVMLAIVLVCRELRRQRPFAPIAARWGRIAAVAIGVGGVLQQVLAGVAGSRLSYEALSVTGWMQKSAWAIEDTGGLGGHGLPLPTVAGGVDLAPIGIALAVWVVAELIAAGARMQAENARLRADTDGLV